MAAIKPKRSPSSPEIQGYTATEKYPKIRSIEVTAADFSGYHPHPMDIRYGMVKPMNNPITPVPRVRSRASPRNSAGMKTVRDNRPPQRIIKISPKRPDSLETRLRDRMIPIQNAERAKLDMKAPESVEAAAKRGIQVFSTICTPI